jgi:hypothetical protein
MIGGFIDSIIPNDLPILGNAIRNLSKVCRNNALGGAMALATDESGIQFRIHIGAQQGAGDRIPLARRGKALSRRSASAAPDGNQPDHECDQVHRTRTDRPIGKGDKGDEAAATAINMVKLQIDMEAASPDHEPDRRNIN